jgi:outer membrane protein
MWQRRGRLALVLTCALAAFQAQAADDLIRQGAELVKAGKGRAAYALLEPQESARAGDKEFDLLFGIAALDAGQNTRAIFALERVLAVDPNNVRARAEMARAYLAVGETKAARAEFESAKKLGVPADVEQTIDYFLSAVDRIDNEGKTVVRGYVEGTFGYDTNVNAGPARSSVAVPGFADPFALSSSSQAAEAWFATLGGGANFSSPVNADLAIVGGLSGSQRWNHDVSSANLTIADANIGGMYTQGKNVYSASAQYNTLRVANDGFRNAAGLSAQWQYNIDARNQFSTYLQYADLDYVDQTLRNANRWVGGAGYAHAWREGLIAYTSAYALQEDVHNKQALYLGLNGYGMRVGAQQQVNERVTLFGNVAYENRRHDAPDPTFLVTRQDEQFMANLSVSYQLNRDRKLTGQYSYVDQRSNIELYAYNRNILSVTIRQEF